MAKAQSTPHNDELPLRPVFDLTVLPGEEKDKLLCLAGPDDTIRAVMYSDLLSSGNFGLTRLAVSEDELIVTEDEELRQRIPLATLASVHCREYVGNAVPVARVRDGDRRVELARYSKTLAEPFQEMAG